jgi:hypothetical protein
MLEGQARVPQERDGQRRLAAEAGEPGTNGPAQRKDVERAEVGEFAALEVAPDLFDGIQFRRVARQSFDRQPRPLLSEILSHDAARVPAEAVPDQNDVTAWEVALEGTQKADQRAIVVTAGPRLEVTAATPAIPAEGQGRCDRQARPVAARMDQDRRVAARRPRAADDRPLRDAAFIFEDDPGAPASRVFFTCGQRARFHWAIAASSRSRAWRVGRWSDQPNRRRRYQTWPGWYRTRVSRSMSVATRGNVHSSVANP